MEKFSKISAPLIVFSYLTVFSALILDSYKNPQKFEHFVLVGPELLLVLVLFINILSRLNKLPPLSKLFLSLNLFLIMPLFSVLTIGLTIWTFTSPPNFVYSKLPFNLEPLFLIAILSGLISLINTPLIFLKTNWQQILFLVPIKILFLGLLISLWPNDFLVVLNKEDHFVENLQFLILTIGSIFAFALGLNFWRYKHKVLSFFYLLVGLGLLIMAGEEISWGQRIFGIVTPEYIANQNSQGEINVHNLSTFVKFIALGYMLVGLYGGLSWILGKLKLFQNLKSSRYFLIPWYLSLFFLPIFIYNMLLPPTKPHGLGEWSEMTELLMYVGVMLFMFINFYHSRKWRII